MGIQYFDRFNAFCNGFQIKYYEQGYFRGDDWQFDQIMGPYNRLYILLDGEGLIQYNGKSLSLKKGYAYVIPANIQFSCHTPLYMEKLYAHFLTHDQNIHDLFNNCHDVLVCDISKDLEEFKSYHPVIMSDDMGQFYHMKHRYDSLIHTFIDKHSPNIQATSVLDMTPMMQDLLRLIEQNLSAQLKTSWLGEQVGMSPATLSKYYKKHMNRNIKQDLTSQLMQKGKILLLTTEKSIQEIAYDLGYTDNLYFTKVFHKQTGLTPTEYRRLNQIYYR